MDGAEILMLEKALKDLIHRWERYFAGDLRVPPQIERDRLARRLRMMTEKPTRRSAERFRVEQLQHRFMTYAQNWERMLREREEGRGRSAALLRAQREASSTDAPPSPSVHPQDEASLYDRFVEARQALGQEVHVQREAFESQLRAQREGLEQKLGHGVQFDVKVEDGKVKLAARRARDTQE